MGTLIVVSGPPGSGTSAVAEALAEGVGPSAVVAGDAFAAMLRGGAGETDAMAAAAAAAGRLAAGGRTVVHHGVLGPWSVPDVLAASGLPFLDYVVLLPDEARVERGLRGRGVHDPVELDAARRVHREFAAARIDSRHVIVDPPHDPAETAALIRHRLAAGALRWAG